MGRHHSPRRATPRRRWLLLPTVIVRQTARATARPHRIAGSSGPSAPVLTARGTPRAFLADRR
jgi:hypothetical protein